MEEQQVEEEYVWGVESNRMMRTEGAEGYGVYVTNRRIFGAKLGKAVPRKIVGSEAVDAHGIMSKLTRNETVEKLSDLQVEKDFEVLRDDVSGLVLKKPGFKHRGELAISSRSGQSVNIVILEKGDYEKLKELLEMFGPEVLKLA